MAASGATPIILYHSTTGSAVPSNANLSPGELALNIADMKLYAENDSGVVTLLASADAAAGNFTTVDTTNIEVTNIKAKDGTAAGSIADSTGVVTLASSVLTTTDINGGTIDGTAIGGSTAAAVSATTLNTSGAVVFNDAGANVDFRVEGDTDANLLFVDASTDRVGIGTASPDGRLHVHNGTAGSVTAQANADDLTVENNANAGISILSPDANVASIYFGSPASAFNAQIESGYNAGAPYLKFNTSATERMRIDSSGNVGIGTSSPSNRLHVSTSLAGSASSSAGIVRIANTRVNTGDGAATLLFVTDEVDGSTQDNRAQIGAEYDGSNGGRLVLSTAQTSTQTMTERMRITSGGVVCINETTQINSGRLCITDDCTNFNPIVIKNSVTQTAGQNFIVFINSAGNSAGAIQHTGTTTVNYATSSDYRLKENVSRMTNALEKVMQLNPVTYTWKEDKKLGQGFIAHELQMVVPDCVTGEKDATEIRQVQVSSAVPATYDEEGNELTPAVEAVFEEREAPVYQGIDTSFLVATLTAAIQELSAKNDALEARIAALEGQ